MVMCKDELDLLADEKKYKDTFERFDTIVRCNGFDPETERELSINDTLELPSASYMLPRVLTSFVQEGVEPLLVAPQLFSRIEYTPGMTTVHPAIDTLQAREVGDGMALPIFNLNVGGNQTFGLTVKRHGLQLRVSQKFVDQSSFPWVSFWMRMAGAALGRHKEEIAWSYVSQLGTSIYDNSTAARKADAAVQPINGCTTGRNLRGALNGSITMDDLHSMYTQIMLQGFVPDTILVHPLQYLSFVRDPIMREFAIMSGGGAWFGGWTGSAAEQAFKGQYNHRGIGQGLGQNGKYVNGKLTGGQTSTAQGLPQTLTSAPVIPNYLGLNFRIITSPFVRFDIANRVGDILMFDSKNLGAFVVAEDPHVNSWTEPGYNVNNIGIEESYGITILNEAQGVGIAKNVAIRPNEWMPQVRPYVNINDATSKFEEKGDITEFGATPTDILAR